MWWRRVEYLHATQSRDPSPEAEPDGGPLGVELGIVHLATDSDGVTISGAVVKQARARYRSRRQCRHSVTTKNAKRRLRKDVDH